MRAHAASTQLLSITRRVPVGPDVNIPPDKSTDTHECVRRSPELQQQVVHFINTGEIDHFCDGPCQYEWTGSCR